MSSYTSLNQTIGRSFQLDKDKFTIENHKMISGAKVVVFTSLKTISFMVDQTKKFLNDIVEISSNDVKKKVPIKTVRRISKPKKYQYQKSLKNNSMIRKLRNEQFKEVEFPFARKSKYAISNYGRMVSYNDDILRGTEINCERPDKVRIYLTTYTYEGQKHLLRLNIARLVASMFVPGQTEEKDHVIHLDHDPSNDYYLNLKWVDWVEKQAHLKKSPAVIKGNQAKVNARIANDGEKLTSTDVIRLKKRLADPNNKTRHKLLAKQFGISPSHLNRIKNGKSWSHIII